MTTSKMTAQGHFDNSPLCQTNPVCLKDRTYRPQSDTSDTTNPF